MKETAPQSVKDAYEAFDDALWDHGGAMNEREWQEKEIPLVHDEDAIVVFGGESMPYSMAGDMTYFQKAWHGSPYSMEDGFIRVWSFITGEKARRTRSARRQNI